MKKKATNAIRQMQTLTAQSVKQLEGMKVTLKNVHGDGQSLADILGEIGV